MLISGASFFERVLAKVAESDGYSGVDTQRDLAAIAASAPYVVDLMAAEGYNIRGSQSTDYTLPVGQSRFTWGAHGDIDKPTPRSVDAWYWVYGGSTYIRGNPLTFAQWEVVSRQELTGTEPRYLYHDMSRYNEGQTVFHVWPTPSADVHLRIYARITPLQNIETSGEYWLQPGDAMLYLLKIWQFVAADFGITLPREFYPQLRAAVAAVQSDGDPVEYGGDPRFLDFNNSTGSYRGYTS